MIQATAFDDLPPSDGTWYYRVGTFDGAGNESELSAEAAARADTIAPRAASIDYSPQGAFDPASGTMAPGTVNLVVTLSELLQSAPYLSIAPDGGIPISVQLHKDTDTTYSGFFVITDTTPGGTAYAIFSGRDVVGNRIIELEAPLLIQGHRRHRNYRLAHRVDAKQRVVLHRCAGLEVERPAVTVSRLNQMAGKGLGGG